MAKKKKKETVELVERERPQLLERQSEKALVEFV